MIVCLNTYEVPADSGEAFVDAFRHVIDLLRSKEGFVSVRLHRQSDGSGKFMTYAQWESLDHQRAAGSDPALAPRMKAVLAIARPKAEWYEIVFEGKP